MKRKFKILGLSVAVSAILVLVIASTVGAAGNDPGTGTQTQKQGAECLCGQGPCGDCVCGDCEPNSHAYNHDYSYLSPGPHGFQKGK